MFAIPILLVLCTVILFCLLSSSITSMLMFRIWNSIVGLLETSYCYIESSSQSKLSAVKEKLDLFSASWFVSFFFFPGSGYTTVTGTGWFSIRRSNAVNLEIRRGRSCSCSCCTNTFYRSTNSTTSGRPPSGPLSGWCMDGKAYREIT